MWRKNLPFYTGLFRIFEYSEQFGAAKWNVAHKILYSADSNVIMMKEKELSEKRGYQKDTFLLHYKPFSKWQVFSNYYDKIVVSVKNCQEQKNIQSNLLFSRDLMYLSSASHF